MSRNTQNTDGQAESKLKDCERKASKAIVHEIDANEKLSQEAACCLGKRLAPRYLLALVVFVIMWLRLYTVSNM